MKRHTEITFQEKSHERATGLCIAKKYLGSRVPSAIPSSVPRSGPRPQKSVCHYLTSKILLNELSSAHSALSHITLCRPSSALCALGIVVHYHLVVAPNRCHVPKSCALPSSGASNAAHKLFNVSLYPCCHDQSALSAVMSHYIVQIIVSRSASDPHLHASE